MLDSHDSSLSRATSASSSAGTVYTSLRRSAWFAPPTRRESAWLAKLMSITDAGWPSAAARLTSRPSAEQVQRAGRRAYRTARLRGARPTRRGHARAARGCRSRRRSGRELATIAPSFITSKCSRAQHVLVAGDGDEDVAHAGRLGDRHHPEAVHHRLQGAQRIDLEHDHVGAHAPRALGQPAPAPAVARRPRTCGRPPARWWRAGCRPASTGRCRSGCRTGAWCWPR